MNSGNINITFDAPELNLTGNGEFNISDYISQMFYQNPTLISVLEEKISDVFNKINSNKIASNYEKKIKDALQIKETKPLDLKNIIEKKIETLFKNLKLDTKGLFLDNFKTNNIQFDSFNKNLEKINKPFKNLNFDKKFSANDNTAGSDTVFESIQKVVVTGFSEDALEELGKLDFEKKKAEKPKEEEKNEIPAWVKLLGGLLGAGLLGWLNKDRIKEWFKEHFTPNWKAWLGMESFGVDDNFRGLRKTLSDLLIGLVGYKAMKLAQLLEKEGFEALFKGGIKALYKPIQYLLDALMAPLNAAGKLFFGAEKTIGMQVGVKLSSITSSIFGSIGKFFGKIFDPLFSKIPVIIEDITLGIFKILKSVGGEAGAKLGSRIMTSGLKIATTGIFKTLLGGLLRKIPIIGFLLSFHSAMTRFKEGNWVGGILDLASGVASMFPGIGTAIAIGIDIFNATLDYKAGGSAKAGQTGINKWFKDKFLKFLKYVPVIGNLIYLSEGLSHLMNGEWSLGFLKLGMAAIPGLNSLGSFFIEKIENKANEAYSSGESPIKKMLIHWLKNQPKYIQYAFKMMGLDIGEMEKDVLPNIEKEKSLRIQRDKELEGKSDTEKQQINKKYRIASLDQKTIFNERNQAIANAKTLEEKQKILDLYSDAIKLKNESIKGQETKTKFVSHDYNKKQVTYQASNDDKLYTRKAGETYAKKDDALGKTFENIEHGLLNMSNILKEQNNIIKNHTEIFKKILNIDEEQLKMLPNLIPIAPKEQPSPMVNTNTRDAIYDYRNNVLRQTLRG